MRTDAPLRARYLTVRSLLRHLSQLEGWALSKGWENEGGVTGDVDLLVEPEARPAIEEKVRHFLRSLCPDVLVAFRCDHVPGVPRLFALAPALGFGDSLLEIDFAELIPLRAYPFIRLERLRPFVYHDPDGVPRLSADAAGAVAVVARLGWLDRRPPIPPTTLAVLERSSPRVARWVWRATWLGRAWGVTLTGTTLAAALARHPGTVARRIRFRLRQLLRGQVCPFDPRAGRAARRVADAARLRDRAIASGHEVVI